MEIGHCSGHSSGSQSHNLHHSHSYSHSISGPFLDPFLAVNPCCCCCGVVPIVNGIKTVATISMVIASSYLVMGCWFAFSAVIAGDLPLPVGTGSTNMELNDTDFDPTENLMNVLLFCGLTSLIGGTIRFLCSLYLLKTAEKESKRPAKFWCVTTFAMIMIVTSAVLAVSQKDSTVFNSLTIEVFLLLAGVDFTFLLYFLWVVIVFVKEEIDMPGLSSGFVGGGGGGGQPV